MKVQIDQNNYFVYDHLRGRLVQLRLEGKIIIQEQEKGLGSGSYLMFPWVNRVEKHPFQGDGGKCPFYDGNGIPLHGFYVNEERKITIKSNKQGSNSIFVKPVLQLASTPAFTEIYTIQKGKLLVEFIILESQQQNLLPYCFGYHPYLQIEGQNIANLQITTDISINLKLFDSLLPVYPYVKQQIIISSNEKYDSLFQGGSFLELANKSGFHVKIMSDLPYWQVYTPPDGKRIAVQPMSFTGNVYKINESGFKPTLKQGKYSITAWQQLQN